MIHDFIRYRYIYIYIWPIGFRVGVTHRIEGSSSSEPSSSGRRGSSRRSRNSRSAGVEVVEVVDVVEVVVLGSSSWRTLAFRASGSTGFHGGRGTRAPVFTDAHEGGRHKRSSTRRTWRVVVVRAPVVVHGCRGSSPCRIAVHGRRGSSRSRSVGHRVGELGVGLSG